MQWTDAIVPVIAGDDLDHDQAYWVMDRVMSGELGEVRLASFLTAMAAKGATVSEIHGLSDAMRDHSVPVDLPRESLDIVGTGGDRHYTVNISTMASIVIAAAGVPVVKHGNRASTSASGSADVLATLGVELELDATRLREVFDEVGIAFLFANVFHPSMKYAAPVRRELGVPTVFNVLGPLTNPARPASSVVGVADARMAPLVAGVLAGRGDTALVVRGQDTGLDELTTADVTEYWEVRDGKVTRGLLDAVDDLGMLPARVADLRGGEAEENARIARRVLDGDLLGPIRDAVVLNAAAGVVTHRALRGEAGDVPLVERMADAVDEVAHVIDEGTAGALLDRWIKASRA